MAISGCDSPTRIAAKTSPRKCIRAVLHFIALKPPLFNLSNVSEFFWSLVLKVCIYSKFISRKKEDSDLVFTFPIIHEMITKFNVVVEKRR